MIMKKSRQQRLNSIPPPPPPPQFASRPPLGSTAARVVASDFYRGKVKSIYDREPLWQEYSTSVSSKGYSMYNSARPTTSAVSTPIQPYNAANYSTPEA